jgi:hypothetical protein
MAVFRFLSAVFLLVAVIALVSDATPPLAGAGPFKATTLLGHWDDLAPNSLAAAKKAVTENTAEWVWTGIVEGLFGWPTFVIFGVLAIASGYLGRRRHKVQIFIN